MNGGLIKLQEEVTNKGVILNLESGVYVLKISTGNRTYRVKHIVVD
jgi:hypothetical protein